MFNRCCCCFTLKRCIIIMAYIDIVTNILAFLMTLFALSAVVIVHYENSERDFDSGEILNIIIFGVGCAICFLEILLAFYLRHVAQASDHHGCRKWLIVASAMFLVGNTVPIALEYVRSGHVVLNQPGIQMATAIYAILEMIMVARFICGMGDSTTLSTTSHVNDGSKPCYLTKVKRNSRGFSWVFA